MCTLTWLHTEDGFELAFNRDEKRTRGPELAAAQSTADGVRFLAPRDADFGGTWITVNEHGVAVALLNAYTETLGSIRSDRLSRGGLVLSLAGAPSVGDVFARAKATELERYEPFVLTAFEAGETVRVERWDGLELHSLADAEPPLISSGVALDRVREHRTALFAAMAEGAETTGSELLSAFHASHAGGPSELSPCMHREDAQTKSSCRVVVSEREVRMIHTPGPPCTTRPSAPLALDRVARVPV